MPGESWHFAREHAAKHLSEERCEIDSRLIREKRSLRIYNLFIGAETQQKCANAFVGGGNGWRRSFSLNNSG